MFEDIEKAFNENFNECKLTNLATCLEIKFNNEIDAKWFEKNVLFPEHLDEDDIAIRDHISINLLDEDQINHFYQFKVLNEKKLIEMLNKHNIS